MSSLRPVVERYYRLFNARDWEAWTALFTEDCAIEVEAGRFEGHAESRAYAEGVVRSFPGIRPELDRVVVESGDTIVVEARLEKRHDRHDLPPADWRLDGSVFEVFVIAGGLIRTLRSQYAPQPADRAAMRPLPLRAQAVQAIEEQAALRRVATLVAAGAPPPEVFDAVVREAHELLGAGLTALARYDDDQGRFTVVAVEGGLPADHVGLPLGDAGDGLAKRVHRTRRPARFDDHDAAAGPDPDRGRRGLLRSAVGAPIFVEGRIWGMLGVLSATGPLAADTEDRLAQFAELVAAAISNAESRAELQASRARVLATADETRRRIERDLHDGAQQRLIHTVVTLKLARAALGDREPEAAALVDESLAQAERAVAELRRLVRGVLPAPLARGGLAAGIQALLDQTDVAVRADLEERRLPPALETTAYFIVAEALTNVAKHARAQTASVVARADGGVLRIEVRDDGVGGAHVAGSSGLIGLRDRVAAHGGQLTVSSPPGGGTTVAVALPLADGPA